MRFSAIITKLGRPNLKNANLGALARSAAVGNCAHSPIAIMLLPSGKVDHRLVFFLLVALVHVERRDVDSRG